MLLSYARLPSAIQPISSGIVIRVTIAVQFVCAAFLVLALILAQGLLEFGTHQLHKIGALGPLSDRLRPVYIPRFLIGVPSLLNGNSCTCCDS